MQELLNEQEANTTFNTTSNHSREIVLKAYELFEKSPDWVSFFREVLGVGGVARQVFSTPEDYLAFEKSEAYAEIQQLVARLRERSKPQADGAEPTRVITVRLPKSLHESLRAEAHDRHTSMNKLCISKLLQMIDSQFVPKD